MPGKPIFGYYCTWAAYRSGSAKCDVDDIDPTLCTHLLYAFVGVDWNGSIVHIDPNFDLPNAHNGMRRFNNLRDQGNRNLKTLVSIGGAKMSQSSIFPHLAGTADMRATFARNVRIFCKDNGFNGADIDWEYPEGGDRSNFVKLLSAVSDEFRRYGLILTTSVGASQWRAAQSYDISGIAGCVDYILLMTYDYSGTWDNKTGHNAPLQDIERDVNYWINQGAPPSKLILGLAAYGRTFTLRNNGDCGPGAPISGAGRRGPHTQEAGSLAFHEVGNEFNLCSGGRNWDPVQSVPYAVCGDQWIGYDDVDSIRIKCEFINRKGLGGAMMWSIDMDQCQGGQYTLLRTVARSL